MKKILILASLLIGMVGNMKADDTVVPTIHGAQSASSWVMTMGLTNANDYVAFQMDVQLPEGVTAGDITVRDRLKDGGTVTINETSQSTNFVVEKNVIDEANNVVRIIGYNLGNHKVVASADQYNDGMFKVALSASSAKDLSAVTAQVKNATFVKASGETLSAVDLVQESAPMTVVNGLAGDANGDGVVDTADKVVVINRFSQTSVPVTFNSKAADINNDGVIDTADGVAIINVLMKQ